MKTFGFFLILLFQYSHFNVCLFESLFFSWIFEISIRKNITIAQMFPFLGKKYKHFFLQIIYVTMMFFVDLSKDQQRIICYRYAVCLYVYVCLFDFIFNFFSPFVVHSFVWFIIIILNIWHTYAITCTLYISWFHTYEIFFHRKKSS